MISEKSTDGCLDPLNVALMLLSKQFRIDVMAKVKDPILRATWVQWERTSDSNQITIAELVMSRLDYLLDNSALKNSIYQSPKLGPDGKSLADFRKWAMATSGGHTWYWFMYLRRCLVELALTP